MKQLNLISCIGCRNKRIIYLFRVKNEKQNNNNNKITPLFHPLFHHGKFISHHSLFSPGDIHHSITFIIAFFFFFYWRTTGAEVKGEAPPTMKKKRHVQENKQINIFLRECICFFFCIFICEINVQWGEVSEPGLYCNLESKQTK